MADRGITTPLGIFHGSGLSAPVISSATAVANDAVRVYYDQEVRRSNPGSPDDAMNPANYTFGVLGGVAITADSVSLVTGAPTTVEVQLTGIMTNGATYTVYVNNVRSIYNELIDPTHNSAVFTGTATSPTVESAAATSGTIVRVQFDRTMEYDSELEKASNYTFSGPTTLDPAVSATAGDAGDKTHVDVTLNKEMHDGSSYEVTASSMSDTGENVIASPPDNQANFNGVGVAPRVNPTATPVTNEAVRVVFDEQVLNATNVGNYSILPSLGILSVTGVVDVYTYELETVQQTSGEAYTITVDNAVTDLAGNPLDAAHDEATFTGTGNSPPEMWMEPESGTDDVQVRTRIRVTARDVEVDHTGINVATLEMYVSYLSETGATVERYVAKPGDFQYSGGEVVGSFQPGFEGIVTGDPLDQVTGVTFHFVPTSRWLPDTLYTLTATVNDNEGTANTNTIIGTFRTDIPACFEDALPSRTALDNTLISGFAYPNGEQLRKILMQECSQSASQLVRARTVMHLANATDLRTILAENFDFALIDEIRLCNRRAILDIHQVLMRYKKNILAAIDEIPRLTNETRDFLRRYVGSASPVYVVNAIAAIVLLMAILGDN